MSERRPAAESLIPERSPSELRHPEVSPLVRLLLDLGPLIAYFAAFILSGRNIYLATAVFMVATAVAMIASKMVAGAISPMLWFSGVLVLVLGGLTVWLKNDLFIKIKPTIYYGMVSSLLWFGLWTGRPTLKLVLGAAYPGLSDCGWAILSRNWAVFFLCLGVANEIVWRNSSTAFWLGYKFWGAFPATLLFAAANIPLMLKHGLSAGKVEATAAEVPPLE